MVSHLYNSLTNFYTRMEQAPFVMWTKRNNQALSSHLNRNPSYDDSWEEQAFAEDALGPLGGCVWPPRSYSCSFCRREFRSAQALGGHMNVHRRDRARLKQSPNNEVFDHHPEHRQDQASQFQNSLHHVSMDLPYPPPLDSGYNLNPNPNCDLFPAFVSPTSPNSRVSASPTDHGNPFYFSSGVKENHTKPTLPSPQSWPNSAANNNRYWSAMSRPITGEKRNLEVAEDGHEEDDSIKEKIPLSLNLVIRARPDAASIDKEEVLHSSKKRRFDDSSLLPLLFNEIRPEKMMDEFTSIREDDLDLELRLGGRPKKVKVQS